MKMRIILVLAAVMAVAFLGKADGTEPGSISIGKSSKRSPQDMVISKITEAFELYPDSESEDYLIESECKKKLKELGKLDTSDLKELKKDQNDLQEKIQIMMVQMMKTQMPKLLDFVGFLSKPTGKTKTNLRKLMLEKNMMNTKFKDNIKLADLIVETMADKKTNLKDMLLKHPELNPLLILVGNSINDEAERSRNEWPTLRAEDMFQLMKQELMTKDYLEIIDRTAGWMDDEKLVPQSLDEEEKLNLFSDSLALVKKHYNKLKAELAEKETLKAELKSKIEEQQQPLLFKSIAQPAKSKAPKSKAPESVARPAESVAEAPESVARPAESVAEAPKSKAPVLDGYEKTAYVRILQDNEEERTTLTGMEYTPYNFDDTTFIRMKTIDYLISVLETLFSDAKSLEATLALVQEAETPKAQQDDKKIMQELEALKASSDELIKRLQEAETPKAQQDDKAERGTLHRGEELFEKLLTLTREEKRRFQITKHPKKTYDRNHNPTTNPTQDTDTDQDTDQDTNTNYNPTAQKKKDNRRRRMQRRKRNRKGRSERKRLSRKSKGMKKWKVMEK